MPLAIQLAFIGLLALSTAVARGESPIEIRVDNDGGLKAFRKNVKRYPRLAAE